MVNAVNKVLPRPVAIHLNGVGRGHLSKRRPFSQVKSEKLNLKDFKPC